MVLIAGEFDKCPKCDKVLIKTIEKLEKGGFVWLEICPDNSEHIKRFREPSFKEAQEFNG